MCLCTMSGFHIHSQFTNFYVTINIFTYFTEISGLQKTSSELCGPIQDTCIEHDTIECSLLSTCLELIPSCKTLLLPTHNGSLGNTAQLHFISSDLYSFIKYNCLLHEITGSYGKYNNDCLLHCYTV